MQGSPDIHDSPLISPAGSVKEFDMTNQPPERRRYERYDTEVRIYFQVKYSLKTIVRFQVLDKEHQRISSQKHSALSKNIGPEGICFSCQKALQKEEVLSLEVYLPGENQPILMEGEVRWSREGSGELGIKKFETGVRIISVNGQPVEPSIYFDSANKIVWSAVLESVFGTFKEFSQKRKR